MDRDMEDVKKVTTTLKKIANPFQPSDDLFSLTSGMKANQQITSDLLGAYEKGTCAMTEFIQHRIMSNEVPF